MSTRKTKSPAPEGAMDTSPGAPEVLPEAPAARGSNGNGDQQAEVRGIERVLDVMVRVSVELGRRRISLAEVVALGPGALIEFTKPAHEPLDVLVNDQLVARGQPVVMGERYGIRITEVVSPRDRLQSSGVVKEVVA